MVFHLCDSAAEKVVEPLHGLQCVRGLFCLGVNAPAVDQSPRIPYLATEVTPLFYLAFIVEDVVAGRGTEQHTDAHRICTVLGDQVQRIRAVAQSLAHLASEFVSDDAGEVHVVERHISHELVTSHNHSGHPEEDNIRTGH